MSTKDHDHLAELTPAPDRAIEHTSVVDQCHTVNRQRLPPIGTLLQRTDQARTFSCAPWVGKVWSNPAVRPSAMGTGRHGYGAPPITFEAFLVVT